MLVSLASLMCIRCLLRRGIPGFASFDGGGQAAQMLNHWLHGTLKGLGVGELPANHTLDKASRDCLMAAAQFARRGMLRELGENGNLKGPC